MCWSADGRWNAVAGCPRRPPSNISPSEQSNEDHRAIVPICRSIRRIEKVIEALMSATLNPSNRLVRSPITGTLSAKPNAHVKMISLRASDGYASDAWEQNVNGM